MRQTSIVVLDKYNVFALGIQSLVKFTSSDRHASIMADYNDLVAQLERNPTVNLAILDLSAPGMEGPETIGVLKGLFPQLRILAVGNDLSREVVFECLRQGAHGCILKTQTAPEIADAIQVVLTGGVYAPVSVIGPSSPRTETLRQRSSHAINRLNEVSGTPAVGEISGTKRMTKQQLVVLDFLVKGLPNKGIARAMNLAEGTVKVHVNSIFKALNVSSRSQAVAVSLMRAQDYRELGANRIVSGGGQDPEVH